MHIKIICNIVLLLLAGFEDVRLRFYNQAKRVNTHLFEGHAELTDYNGKVDEFVKSNANG